MTTRPQTPFSMSLFSILTTTAALAVFLSAATSQAATVVTEGALGDDNFASFTGVDAPPASDYADQNAGNGVTVAESAGSPINLFGGLLPATALNDGIFAGLGVIFENTTQLDGRYHYDLMSAIEIGKITSYASNGDPRAGQKHSVWGSAAGTIPSTATTLSVDDGTTGVGSVRSDLELAGWTLIADVQVDQSSGSSGAMITPDGGISLGSYRWLMFNVQLNGAPGSNQHPFMLEIDVYQAIPEPSTFALALMSLGCLVCWRRRRRA